MSWKGFLVLILGFCVLVTPGCALTYMKEKKTDDGVTERTFGLLGGLLPLWHYEGQKPPEPKQKAADQGDIDQVQTPKEKAVQ